ncbi:restriction endonuclease subunit S [Paenibacillus sp. FSL R7-0345]|uniref:restriction endonuclease subunit S n=1 Tax=Paenibacillus sp. FSL R7-0345 TaxID=2954535 RepID=UPI00315A8366
MSKNKGKTAEELLQEALVPVGEQPYNLPVNWIWVKSEYVAKWGSGGTPSRKNPEYYGGDIPWIKTGDLRNGIITEVDECITDEGLKKSSAKMFPKDSVAIAMYGATIGKLGILGFDATTNQACAVGVPLSITTTKFLFYYFLSQKDELISLGKGGAQPNISQQVIKQFPFALPPLAEQERIVQKTEKLLNKINQAKQLIEEAKETFEIRRAAILDKAFRGELTAKWREENLSKATAGSFLQKIDEFRQNSKTKVKKSNENIMTEPYKLPEGWRWVTLEDLIQTSSYGTSAKTNDDDDVPVLRMGNIIDGELHLDNLKYLPSDHKDVEKYKLEEYDLLFNRTNSYELVGKTAVVYGQATNMTYASYLVNVRLFYKEEIAEYICYYINGHFGRNLLLSMVTQQVGQANINASKLASLIVPLPPKDEIVEITNKINSLIEIERSIVNSLQLKNDLDKLTEAILYSAFRGDLGTNDASEPSEISKLLELKI